MFCTRGRTAAFFVLWAVSLNGCALPVRYNLQVVCEVKDGSRALQVVSYDTKPMPRLSAHVGGTAHLMGVRYIDGMSATWLIEENTGLSGYGRRLCALSSLPSGRAIVFPANMHFTISTGSEVGPNVERLISDVVVNNTLIAFDGTRWFVNAIRAVGEPANARHQVGKSKLSAWTTVFVKASNGKMIALQSATLQESVEPLIKGDKYLPRSAFAIQEIYAYGETLPFDTEKFGSFDQLRPVVERTLESTNSGRTWQQVSWKLLDRTRVPGGGELRLVPLK